MSTRSSSTAPVRRCVTLRATSGCTAQRRSSRTSQCTGALVASAPSASANSRHCASGINTRSFSHSPSSAASVGLYPGAVRWRFAMNASITVGSTRGRNAASNTAARIRSPDNALAAFDSGESSAYMYGAICPHAMSAANGLGSAVVTQVTAISPLSSSARTRYSAGRSNSSTRQVRNVSSNTGKSAYCFTVVSSCFACRRLIHNGRR